ncbi:MAG: EAL domain-containing protein, partial [Methylobacter sp.]
KEPEKMVVTLARLKEIGVQISMDDFGTGYSSLSYLKRFLFDNFKIDKTFINDIPIDKVVAEGRNIGADGFSDAEKLR